MSESAQPPADAGTVPHCYRHTDRETYISCQRCGRPICPDCMRQASVGFQCPECVREASTGTRQVRTTFGGRLTQGPAVITYALISVNVLFFFIANADGGTNSDFVARMGLFTSIDFPRQHLEGVAQGSYWQLITSTFLHTEIWHIASNMIGLWFFGQLLENQLGRWRFLALYLVSGLAGSVLYYLLTPAYSPGSGVEFALGASGAVFGLFAAGLIVLVRQRRDVSQLVLLIGFNLFITFTVPGIAWQGHLGGLAAGALLGAAFAYAPRERRQLVGVGAVVTTTLICVVLVAVRTAALT